MHQANRNIADAAAAAVAETFENMAFLAVEPSPPEEAEAPGETWCWARIAIKRPAEGEILFACPRTLAADITEVVFGPAQEVTDATVNDALAELANTIAGRCADRLVDPGTPFDLGLPATGRGAPEPPAGAQACPCITEDGRGLCVYILWRGES
jgi:CheY-specific phosphatase CheX